MRTVPYDTSRDALYRPHLAPSIFPVPSLSEELLCAESSRLVYKHFERPSSPEKREIEAALGSVGFTEIAYFAQEESQAFAAWNSESETAVVAFRGTEQDDPTDLADDLDTLPDPWEKGGKVHGGFKRAFHKIWGDDINSWIDRHQGRQLLFTGHSLGAALATLAASLRKPGQLITFGSPRVGDADFLDTLPVAPIAYVDCCDLVTHLPPPLFGFEHPKTRIYIDRLGQVTPGATEELIREDGWTARQEYLLHHSWRRGSVAVRDLADHAPINYVYALA